MKFDLFDCMNIMRKNFGKKSEVLLHHFDRRGVIVRLRVFKQGRFHSVEFVITQTEIDSDGYIDATNKKFGNAIEKLRCLILC